MIYLIYMMLFFLARSNVPTPIGSAHVSYHVCVQRCPENLQLSRGHIGWEQHGGKGALSHRLDRCTAFTHLMALFHLVGPFLYPTTLKKRAQASSAKIKSPR